ncbi:MAG: DUF4348 domain-containing protein [Cyanothece sp. SIO1E1]|nr:DUF4348 domain-containing protein [Cyanothece sp. SIO1E1]
MIPESYIRLNKTTSNLPMRTFSLLLFLPFILLSCKQKEATAEVEGDTLPKDFIAFYERFLQDSLYQMEHINFPLEGIPDNALKGDQLQANFRWQQENWIMHRPIPKDSTGFNSSFSQLGPIIIEEILHESGQYGMLRRFANDGEDWRLIYYAGLNPLKQ